MLKAQGGRYPGKSITLHLTYWRAGEETAEHWKNKPHSHRTSEESKPTCTIKGTDCGMDSRVVTNTAGVFRRWGVQG